MKEIIIIFLAVVLGVFSLGYYSFRCGEKNKQQEIIHRALQLDKDCYSNADLELIIFNEKQL